MPTSSRACMCSPHAMNRRSGPTITWDVSRIVSHGKPWSVGLNRIMGGAAPGAPGSSAEAKPDGEAAAEQVQSASLDFLAHSSAVLVNLVPDESGAITIDRQLLKSYQRGWGVAV